jgi:cytochrome P450
VLRYEPPLQLIDRLVTADTTIGDVAVRKGDKVTAVVASANRDAAAFGEHPDGFRADRDTDALLTFGDGIHRCIGEPLARAIAPPALELLLAAPVPEPDGTPQWQTDPYLRGLVSLPVRY